MRLITSVLLLLVLPLVGCATPSSYKDVILPVKALDQADGSILVLASGNGYTPLEAVGEFTYLKAAETVQARGHKCFEVLGENTRMTKQSTPSLYGGAYLHYFPEARLRIKILPELTDCEVNNAARLIEELTPRVEEKDRYRKLRQDWDKNEMF